MTRLSNPRVLVCGDRNWDDAALVEYAVRRLRDHCGGISCIIEGEAKGADTHGRLAAEKLGLPVAKYPADWKRLGKAAGPVRNRQMLLEGRPDVVLAFHHNIEHSKGTRNMVMLALDAGLTVWLFEHGPKPRKLVRMDGGLFEEIKGAQ